VLPSIVCLGLPWQYQRIARDHGPSSIISLVRSAFQVNLLMLAPIFLVTFALGSSYSGPDNLLLLTTCTLIISLTTSLTTLYSQAALGLRRRSLSNIMLFAVNGGVVVGVAPIALLHHGTVTGVLEYWSLASLVACAWSLLALRLLARDTQPTVIRPSLREGLLSIPVSTGPFLFIFLVRYTLGLNLSPSALSQFAISSTVADMALLIAVSLVGVYSNRIMDGENPNRSLVLALPALLLFTAVGIVILTVILPLLARHGYSFSVSVTLLLTVAASVRLFISAWQYRAVALRKVQASVWLYIPISLAATAVLAIWRPTNMIIYGATIIAGFLAVAVYMWTTVRSHSVPEPPLTSRPAVLTHAA
jgi:hypothetical protein